MVSKIESDAQFKDIVDIESQGRLVVIDFFATWCGSCTSISPAVDNLSTEFPNASFYKIDIDELQLVAQNAGILSMPTFLFFKNGERIFEVVGADVRALKTAVETNV